MMREKIEDPTKSEFEMLRAQELACLGREARYLYLSGLELTAQSNNTTQDISQQLPTHLPLHGPLPKPFEGKEYKILAPLVFTQIVLRFIGQRRCFGFIAEPLEAKRQNQEIFIVYRGSQTVWDWVSNFRIFQTKERLFPSPNDPNYGIRGEVHRGFNDQYTRPDRKRKQPSISEIVESTLTPEIVNNRTIYVAGHSLGGALATLTAAHIKHRYPNAQVCLYTTASPRVGDDRFEEFFRSQQIDAFRIYNQYDLVPKLPPRFESPFEAAQYVHVGDPIPFTHRANSLEFKHTLPIYACALNLDPEAFNYLDGNKSLPFSCSLP